MIKAEVITTLDEATLPQSVWDRLLTDGNTNTVFQNRDWLQIWLRTLGTGAEPFFIRLTEEGQVVGLIPLVIVTAAMGLWTLRVLQFAGQPLADYSEFLVTGDRTACLEAALACMLAHRRRWDMAELAHICETSPNLPCWTEVLRQAAVPHQVWRYETIHYAELGASFEEYWSGRSQRLRNEVGKKERNLALLGPVTFERYRGGEALARFDSFIEFIEAHGEYKEQTGTGRWYDQDRDFLWAALSDAKLAPYLHFSSLNVADRPIAYSLGFIDSRAFYCYKFAFSPAYAKYSPGMLILKQLFMAASQANVAVFDFLLGGERYKYRWATSEHSSYNVRLFHGGGKSRLAGLWLVGIRPGLKESGLLVELVKAARRLRHGLRSLWPY